MKIKIDKIIIRDDLYPRLEIDTKKIQEYSENLEKLPKIELNQDKILIDGMHRLKAHLQAGLDEIEYTVYETKDDDDILMRAIELNATFGIQLSYKDKKKLAVNITKNKLEKEEDSTEIKERLVKVLSISDDTYNKWTRDIRESYDKQIRDQIIQEYLMAERTQKQIADKFEVDQKTVTNYVSNLGIKINLLFFLNPTEFFGKNKFIICE